MYTILYSILHYITYYIYLDLDTDITMNIRDSWCELQDTEMPRIKSLTLASCFGQGGPVSDLGPGQPRKRGSVLNCPIKNHENIFWLVVSSFNPLKNISQLELFFPIYGKMKNVPNHQPDI